MDPKVVTSERDPVRTSKTSSAPNVSAADLSSPRQGINLVPASTSASIRQHQRQHGMSSVAASSLSHVPPPLPATSSNHNAASTELSYAHAHHSPTTDAAYVTLSAPASTSTQQLRPVHIAPEAQFPSTQHQHHQQRQHSPILIDSSPPAKVIVPRVGPDSSPTALPLSPQVSPAARPLPQPHLAARTYIPQSQSHLQEAHRVLHPLSAAAGAGGPAVGHPPAGSAFVYRKLNPEVTFAQAQNFVRPPWQQNLQPEQVGTRC